MSSSVPVAVDPTFLLVNAIKDDGSNTRSDVTALDRNLSGLSNANTTAIMQSADRTNLHNNIVEDARFRDSRDTTNRGFDGALNETRRNTEFMMNAVERNGTANALATQTTSSNTQQAIERNASQIGSAVDRNGGSNELATERSSSLIRDLVNASSQETRNYTLQNHTDIKNSIREGQFFTKDAEIRAAEQFRLTEVAIANTNYNVLKSQNVLESLVNAAAAGAARDAANAVRDALNSKNEVMRQAADYANSSTRDILGMRADVMRQAADNTTAIIVDGNKNKDLLANKMDNQYSDLKQRIADSALLQRDVDSARLRDNANDYRIENAILKERHHGHHGHEGHRHSDGHIHNNLYSGHNGYPHHQERRFFGGGGGGGGGFGGEFGGGFGGGNGFGPNGIQSQSNSN